MDWQQNLALGIILTVMLVGAYNILLFFYNFIKLCAEEFKDKRCPYMKLCAKYNAEGAVCNSTHHARHDDYDHKCFKKRR